MTKNIAPLPLISDEEAQAFYTHAKRGAQVDLEGEGVKYSVIQPYDLQRLAVTVTALRRVIASARKATVRGGPSSVIGRARLLRMLDKALRATPHKDTP